LELGATHRHRWHAGAITAIATDHRLRQAPRVHQNVASFPRKRESIFIFRRDERIKMDPGFRRDDGVG
jgi:hypothetical protein